MKEFWVIFAAVFIAELGDKTQLATFMFATNDQLGKLGIFLASSAALSLSALLAVLLGGQIANYIDPGKLKIVAGVGFILIGLWTVKEGLPSLH